MSKQHTRTPWEVKPEEVDKPYMRIRGTVCGSRFKIANVLTPVYEGVPEWEVEETRANAEFIVRCVNSHQDLVDALEAARPFVSDAMVGSTRYRLSEQISKILVKAKGE